MTEGLVVKFSRLLGDVARGDLPPAAQAAAKNRLFHALGVSLTSSSLSCGEVARNTVRASTGGSLAFGRTQRMAAEDAAFVNGVIGHGSLLEDCGPGGLREGSHPGTYIIPAALAAADEVEADGRRLLAGLIVGYEAVSRIGAAAPAAIVKRRFRPVGVMGPFGAAAAAATIFGVSDSQMASALSIAANLSGGSTQGIFEGTMEPYFHAGFSARNGVFSARIALSSPATASDAFEGEFGFFQTYGGEAGDANALLAPRDALGIGSVGTKRFAACLQNQQTVALIVDGLKAPLSLDDIERVIIARPDNATNGLKSPGVSRTAPFRNMLSAQMSARFTAASALLGHPVHDPRFFQANFGNPEIRALTDRIDLIDAANDIVSIRLVLRGRPDIVLDENRSDVLFPDAQTIRADFLKRAEPFLGPRAQIAAELIDNLEHLRNVRELTDALTAHAA